MDPFKYLKQLRRAMISVEVRILEDLKEGDKYDVGKIWDEKSLADLQKLDNLLLVLLSILKGEGVQIHNLPKEEILKHLHKLIENKKSLLQRSEVLQIKEIERLGAEEWFKEFEEEIKHLNSILGKIFRPVQEKTSTALVRAGTDGRVSVPNGQEWDLKIKNMIDLREFPHLQIIKREDENERTYAVQRPYVRQFGGCGCAKR